MGTSAQEVKTPNEHIILPTPQSFFAGPHGERAHVLKKACIQILEEFITEKQILFPSDPRVNVENSSPKEQLAEECLYRELYEVSKQLSKELPLASGRYVAHMLSERSLPGILGQFIGVLYNANNVTTEASRASLDIEREAISSLARMIGYSQATASGHFTSGGTLANYESVSHAKSRLMNWLAVSAAERSRGNGPSTYFESSHLGWNKYDQMLRIHKFGYVDGFHLLHRNPFDVAALYQEVFGHPYRGPVMILPGSAHYSWEKAAILNGIGREALWTVETDSDGKIDLSSLKKRVEQARKQDRPILMVLSVAGTTELGSIDPVDQIQNYLDELADNEGIHIWHHVDGAWGGFLRSLLIPGDNSIQEAAVLGSDILTSQGLKALEALGRTNSITVDPHKMGYVPYSAGAFLTENWRDYSLGIIQAPYIQWESIDKRPPQTLEGSRPSGGAIATLLTDKIIGLHAEGLGLLAKNALESKISFVRLLQKIDSSIRIVPVNDSSIICFCLANEGESTSQVNLRTNSIFESLRTDTEDSLIVSKTDLNTHLYESLARNLAKTWEGTIDSQGISLIRICFLNPHLGDDDYRNANFQRYEETLSRFIKQVH